MSDKAKKFDAVVIVDQTGEPVAEVQRIQNIGDKGDFIHLPYSSLSNSVLAYLNTGYYHIHGESFIRPNHANSVQLTAQASAWGVGGTIVEVIPANSITKAFDLHWITISAISENSEIQVDIYSGSAGNEVLIGSAIAVRNAVMSQEGAIRIQIPQQPANTRISCKLSSSTVNATTANVKFMGHTYG